MVDMKQLAIDFAQFLDHPKIEKIGYYNVK